MKYLFKLLLVFFGFMPVTFSQTVDSIKVEQAGDIIKIHYKILKSDESQVFRITLSCIVSSGMKMEPRSLSGDYGENVIGGRANYMIVWDVLKDVDELQSAEFSVKAELIKGRPSGSGNINLTGWDKKRIHVFLATKIPGPRYGIKIGYMGSWGVCAAYGSGRVSIIDESPISPKDIPNQPFYSLDLTRRIVNRNSFQLHLNAGYSKYAMLFAPSRGSSTYEFKDFSFFNLGMVMAFNRIIFSFESNNPLMDIGKIEKSSNTYLISNDVYFNFGIGVRF
jgi:hypothetical protein